MINFLNRVKRYLIKRINVVYYKLKYLLLRRDVRWGKSVKISGKFVVEGPGKVIIGDNVFIDGSGQPVTVFTHDIEARIVVGDNTFLNGTRFGCVDKIVVGANCLIAECNIIDTDFHPVDPDARLRDEPGRQGPVYIGNNVWIAGAAFILCQTKIGDNSTVGALSVVKGDFEERSLIAGNPAKLIKTL